MYVLYHAPGSSSMAAHIALQEVGAPFETRIVNLLDRSQDPPSFRGLTVEGRVPVLMVEGRPLTEVAAILYFLARAHPHAGLFPDGDTEAEAQVVSWLSFIASTLHPARQRGEEHATRVWGWAEAKLGGRNWACGAYSIADIHLFRLFWRFRATIGADRDGFPGLYGHYERMMQRPAVQATLKADQEAGYNLPA